MLADETISLQNVNKARPRPRQWTIQIFRDYTHIAIDI